MNNKNSCPLISVIVPIYKVEDYMDESVESIINQTYKNIEIILVDDGSPDKCPQKCDEWVSRDNRIRVIHKKNGGLSSARNVGVENAKGEYISFIDSDDTILPDFLEQLYKGFSLFDNVGVTAVRVLRSIEGKTSEYNSKWIYSDPNIIRGGDYSIKMVTGECCYTAWNKMYRADLCKQISFKEGRNNEDSLYQYYLGKIMCEKNLNLLQLPYVGYIYRMTPNSICTSAKTPLFVDIIKNIDEMMSDSKRNVSMYQVLRIIYIRRLFVICDSLVTNKIWYPLYYGTYRNRLCKISNREIFKHIPFNKACYIMMHKYFPILRKTMRIILS